MNALPLKMVTLVTGLLVSAPVWSAQTSEQMKETEQFLSDLHMTNQMEMQMGRMAKEKGASQQVRDYGEKLVKDHQDADQKVQEVARKTGITLTGPSTEGFLERYKNNNEQDTMADLSAKSGPEFDKAFAEAMIDDHERDIAKLEKAQKSLKQPDVRHLVSQVLPKLREHLEIAQRIEKTS